MKNVEIFKLVDAADGSASYHVSREEAKKALGSRRGEIKLLNRPVFEDGDVISIELFRNDGVSLINEWERVIGVVQVTGETLGLPEGFVLDANDRPLHVDPIGLAVDEERDLFRGGRMATPEEIIVFYEQLGDELTDFERKMFAGIKTGKHSGEK
jgi:hypothetical protein